MNIYKFIDNFGVGLISLSWFLYINVGISQNNSDCITPIIICKDTIFISDKYGYGNVLEFPSPDSVGSTLNNPIDNSAPTTNYGCLLKGEVNSTWLSIPIKASGTLEIYFAKSNSSNPQNGFYTWTMFNMTNNTCQNIINNKIAPIRCNWNTKSQGGTGLAAYHNLPDNSDSVNYEAPLKVEAGETYYICFNNLLNPKSKIPVEFGGTAKTGYIGMDLGFRYIIIGLNVIFINDSKNTSIFQWEFGDGFTGSSKEPVHSYIGYGIYKVCLTGFDGCSSDSICQDVTIKDTTQAIHEINNDILKNNIYIYTYPQNKIMYACSEQPVYISGVNVYSLNGSIDKSYFNISQSNTIKINYYPVSNGIYIIAIHTNFGIYKTKYILM